MVARVSTVAFQGIEGLPVDVQVMVAPGKVGMQIVGLPDKAVAESRERVQAALHASGLALPARFYPAEPTGDRGEPGVELGQPLLDGYAVPSGRRTIFDCLHKSSMIMRWPCPRPPTRRDADTDQGDHQKRSPRLR